MIRMTNKKDQATKVVYVEKPVIVEKQVPVVIEAKAPDAIIQYVDREVIHEVQVPGDTIIMDKTDLLPLHAKNQELETKIKNLVDNGNAIFSKIGTELEMQRRALVAIKMQRDVDRKRRLTLLKKLKREKDAHESSNLKLKLAMGASILIAIVSLIVKL